MTIVRSFLFSAGFLVSLILFFILLLFIFPLPVLRRYAILSYWARFILWWLKLTCKIDFEIKGAENIPHDPLVVLSNHQSTWETIALQKILPPQTWVLKRELLRLPIFGWCLAALKPVAIDRSSKIKALQQVLNQGKDRLITGLCVIIFPEGTRVAVGETRRYSIGGAKLAKHAGYPVLPVAHNAGQYWPKKGFVKRAGTIYISIGQPIDTADKTAQEITQIVETWTRSELAAFEQ